MSTDWNWWSLGASCVLFIWAFVATVICCKDVGEAREARLAAINVAGLASIVLALSVAGSYFLIEGSKAGPLLGWKLPGTLHRMSLQFGQFFSLLFVATRLGCAFAFRRKEPVPSYTKEEFEALRREREEAS